MNQGLSETRSLNHKVNNLPENAADSGQHAGLQAPWQESWEYEGQSNELTATNHFPVAGTLPHKASQLTLCTEEGIEAEGDVIIAQGHRTKKVTEMAFTPSTRTP